MMAFKAAVRWNATHNVSAKDERMSGTSYARHNRLVGLGVTNKHAAIRRMPILKIDQAKAVSKQREFVLHFETILLQSLSAKKCK